MVALMVAITITMIFLTAAAEKWSTIIRRDMEEELVFRGLQYARAIADFQKEHGALPTELDVLTKKGPRGHRYIRQLFRDPFTKDGKWSRLILAPGGQAVVNPMTQEMRPTSMLMQGAGTGQNPAGQPIGPQTPQQFGLRAQRQSTRFPGRGQQATPPGQNLFRSSVTQISPFPSEQLVGGPIAGVASANIKDKAYRIYEGYDRLREFWFTVFKFSQGPAQPPGGGEGFIPGGLGPGLRIQQRTPGGGRRRPFPGIGGGRRPPAQPGQGQN